MGAGCLLCRSALKDGQSALVPGGWGNRGHWPDDQVHHCVLTRRDFGWNVSDQRPSIFSQPVVLVWCGPRALDLPAQSRLAGAPQLHLLPLPSPHSRTRHKTGKSQRILDQAILCVHKLLCRPALDCGPEQLLAHPALSPYRVDVPHPIAALFFANGLYYYLGAAYPMLIAMGAVVGESWSGTLSSVWRNVVRAVFFTGIAGAGLYACVLVLPLASSGPLMHFALRNNDTLREEIGWPDLVKNVAAIRDSLPPAQQDAGVLVGNYGEQGAIELFGPAYYLPPPTSLTNSAWLRGHPSPPPSTLIVLGFSREGAEEAFASCRLAGHNANPYGIKNEESESHPDIFVCAGPRLSWPEFWKKYQNFG